MPLETSAVDLKTFNTMWSWCEFGPTFFGNLAYITGSFTSSNISTLCHRRCWSYLL